MALPMLSPRPMMEYTKDMTAATMLTHQISSMLGICVNRSCMAPKMIMYLHVKQD